MPTIKFKNLAQAKANLNPSHLHDITFVFDFDSTLTQVEAFEELGEVSLKQNPDKDTIIAEIKRITDLGIDGEISFTESLERRIAILGAERKHLDSLVNRLKKKISGSVKRNLSFFKEYSSQIIVISAGFKEFIDPILNPLGISSEKIYANTFMFGENGEIIGFDKENELSKPDGKIYQLKKLNLEGRIFVIGDGYSDYQMREAGIAHKFFAYTENITRQKILSTADHITPSFDEFLYLNKIKGSISYPKNRILVVLETGIDIQAEEVFAEEGYTVKWADKKSLGKESEEASVICSLNASGLAKSSLTENKKLLCAASLSSLSVDDDLHIYTQNGLPVFHSPKAEAESRAEYVLLKLLQLSKTPGIGDGLLGKLTVGISGLGSEGFLVAEKLDALGIKTVFYAPAYPEGVAKLNRVDSFSKLVSASDLLVLCRNFKEEYPKINKSSFPVNQQFGLVCSGGLSGISTETLKYLYQKNSCLAAAIDTTSPSEWEELRLLSLKQKLDLSLNESTNSTFTKAESATQIAQSLIAYINTGNTSGCVNLPSLNLPEFPNSHRLLHIHRNVPGVLANINTIFSKHRINISHQHLSTNKQIGYLITDIDKKYNNDVLDELKKVPATVRFRVLY